MLCLYVKLINIVSMLKKKIPLPLLFDVRHTQWQCLPGIRVAAHSLTFEAGALPLYPMPLGLLQLIYPIIDFRSLVLHFYIIYIITTTPTTKVYNHPTIKKDLTKCQRDSAKSWRAY